MRLLVTIIILTLATCFSLSLVCAESERVFSSQGCKYTLPGPSWEWVDDAKIPDLVFMARDDTGLVLTLTVRTAPAGATIRNEFIDGMKQSMRKSVLVEKRGSGEVQFKGLTCYQFELLYKSQQKTAIIRVFIVHGSLYMLNLLGTEEPVENHPAFEDAMNGFDFLQSKEPVSTPQTQSKDDLREAGKQVGNILILLFVLGLIVWGVQKFRKK